MTNDIGVLQTLLNAQACLSNSMRHLPDLNSRFIAERTSKQVICQIELMRGDIPPPCYGDDDCSTQALSVCPWRMTCGS
jgi:hypothetical protein